MPVSTPVAGATAFLLPTGRWTVDEARTSVGFRTRGAFGLVPVKGVFGDVTGRLEVDGPDAHGELLIAATSLDTGNARRDAHLRSDDFFAVDEHPTVVFTLDGVVPGPEGLVLAGNLQIRDNRLAVSAPLTIETSDGSTLRLGTRVSVDRAAAGVRWSKAGMVRGAAHLHADVALRRIGD